jgi:hypothetical protein
MDIKSWLRGPINKRVYPSARSVSISPVFHALRLMAVVISRQVATLFLGILFATSVYYFANSPTLASIVSRLVRRRTAHPADVSSNEPESKSTSTSIQQDPASLVFILNLIYITTAATEFASLLAFSSSKGEVSCTFLAVWASLGGPMTLNIADSLSFIPISHRLGTETVRLIGLLKLTLHLRELRQSIWERLVLWGALALLAVVMFLSTAVSTGVLRQIPQNQSLSLCYMRQCVPSYPITDLAQVSLQLHTGGSRHVRNEPTTGIIHPGALLIFDSPVTIRSR